jgi:hypothetical protein
MMMMMMMKMIVRIRYVTMMALNPDRLAHTIKLNRMIAEMARNIMHMHTTRALFKVAYHQVEEVILHAMIKLVAHPNFFLSS